MTKAPNGAFFVQIYVKKRQLRKNTRRMRSFSLDCITNEFVRMLNKFTQLKGVTS